MRHTLETVVPYLLERKLVRASDVVENRVQVIDASRRNRAFKVLIGEDDGLMIKQKGQESEEMERAIRTEAKWGTALARTPSLKPLRWFVPRLRAFDEEHMLVVNDIVRPAASLTRFHANEGKVHFPTDVAETTGRMMGLLHNAGDARTRQRLVNAFPPETPHITRVNYGMGTNDMAKGTAALGRWTGQQDGLDARVRALKTEWRQETIVHGDVRWDNFLITSGAAPGPNVNIRMIDWESVGAGEAAWDVASYLSEFVRIHTNPIIDRRSDAAPDPRNVEPTNDKILVPFQTKEFTATAASFWRAYVKKRRLTESSAAALWERTMWMMPAKLLQVAMEQTQRTDETPPRAKRTGELAVASLEDPVGFGAQMFGIKGGA